MRKLIVLLVGMACAAVVNAAEEPLKSAPLTLKLLPLCPELKAEETFNRESFVFSGKREGKTLFYTLVGCSKQQKGKDPKADVLAWESFHEAVKKAEQNCKDLAGDFVRPDAYREGKEIGGNSEWLARARWDLPALEIKKNNQEEVDFISLKSFRCDRIPG